MPKVYIKTFGCQMNNRDSEAIFCLLEDCGMSPAGSEEEADIIILNTCSVRETAENKAIGKAGTLVRLKRSNPDLILAIVGCMAQNHGAELFRKIPHLDIVAGTDQLDKLPAILEEAAAGKRGRVEIESTGTLGNELTGHRNGGVSAFVSVMRGCNQYCSYCIVPYVRGREKSRPITEVVKEVEELVENGCREAFLLGQNITAYGLAEMSSRNIDSGASNVSPFADLLEAVNEVPGLFRIRFTSPHPRYMNDRFVEAAARADKVCESFHIPLQSGSDRILERMRRGYWKEDYRVGINKLRKAIPNITFSTDIIVGFPGETEDDFNATREIMEEIGFDMAYIYKYSPRPGTKAAGWEDDVPSTVKEERNQVLLEDLNRRARQRNRDYIGRNVEILIEGPSKRNSRRWSGRTRENKVCHIDFQPGINPGTLAGVRVERVTDSSLFGKIEKYY